MHSKAAAKSNQTSDKRILNTKKQVRDALMALLEEGTTYRDLSITLLTQRAGISRKAFYDRFGSINQMFVQIGTEIFASAAESVEDRHLALPLSEGQLGSAIVKSFVSHPFDVILFIKSMPGELLSSVVEDATQSILSRTLSINNILGLTAVEKGYLVRYSSGAMSGMVMMWAERNFDDDPDTVGRFFMTLFAPGMDQFLRKKQLKSISL